MVYISYLEASDRVARDVCALEKVCACADIVDAWSRSE